MKCILLQLMIGLCREQLVLQGSVLACDDHDWVLRSQRGHETDSQRYLEYVGGLDVSLVPGSGCGALDKPCTVCRAHQQRARTRAAGPS
jgi:hypothetical protein